MQQTSLRYYICHYISLIWKKTLRNFFSINIRQMQAGQNNEYDYIFIYYSKKQFLHLISARTFSELFTQKTQKVWKNPWAQEVLSTQLYQSNFIKSFCFYQFLTLIFMGFTLNFTKLTNWFDFHWLSFVAKQCLNLAYKFNLLCRKMSKDIANQIWPLWCMISNSDPPSIDEFVRVVSRV